jgi:hypothetical protein
MSPRHALRQHRRVLAGAVVLQNIVARIDGPRTRGMGAAPQRRFRQMRLSQK